MKHINQCDALIGEETVLSSTVINRYGKRACRQHYHNATFHWNFQKYSVKMI